MNTRQVKNPRFGKDRGQAGIYATPGRGSKTTLNSLEKGKPAWQSLGELLETPAKVLERLRFLMITATWGMTVERIVEKTVENGPSSEPQN